MNFLLRVSFGILVFSLSGCSRSDPEAMSSATKTDDTSDDSDIQSALKGLKGLEVKGSSGGGPYVGIGYSEAVDRVVAQGDRIVPHLLKRMDESDYAETVYIVFCLHALEAKNAKEKILELQKAERNGSRFRDKPHDLTLMMQIKYFLRDVDTWK
jgi:hypothetical protein